MRLIAAFLLFVLAAAPAIAQDDLEARTAKAREFVTLTTADSVMGPMVDAVWPAITAQLPSNITSDVAVMDRLKATFATEITNALGDVLDEMAGVYAGAFTLDELNIYVEFYSSPAGAKLVATQGVLMQQMMPTITTRLQETLPQAIQAILQEAQSAK